MRKTEEERSLFREQTVRTRPCPARAAAACRRFFSAVRKEKEGDLLVFPNRVWFAREMGVSLATLTAWEKENPALREALSEGEEVAAALRAVFAENGKLNATVSKFLLETPKEEEEKEGNLEVVIRVLEEGTV